MTMRPNLVWRIVGLLGLPAIAGCFDLPEFSSASLVDRPRILAVVADPPEVRAGEVTQLSILVAGADEVSDIRWRACSLAKLLTAATQYGENVDDRGCPDDESVFATGDHATWNPQDLFFDLAAGGRALGGNLPASVVEVIRADVGIAFTIEVDVLADGKRLRALKRVLVSQNKQPGTNPPPPRFRFGESTLSALDNTAGSVCEVDSGSLQVAPGSTVKLDPVVDGDKEPWLESYTVLDARGVLGTRKEQAFYSWFATEGKITHGTTQAPRRESGWRAPDQPGCTQLWVVVRDGHGGQSACGVKVAVGDESECGASGHQAMAR